MSGRRDNSETDAGILARAFLRYRESLRRYIARLVIRAEDVDDILQDTFLNVHRLKDSDGVRSPKFYLFAVARRTAFRELKRQSERMAESIDEAIEKGTEPPADLTPLDQAFEARAHFETLTDVISELPRQCRRVFILRKVFGFSHKEISAAMGISTSTVEKYLGRAMMRCLQDHRLRAYQTDATDMAAGDAPVKLSTSSTNE